MKRLSIIGVLLFATSMAQAASCNVLIGAYDSGLSKDTIETVKGVLKDKGYSPMAVVTHISELRDIQISDMDYMVDLFQDHDALAGKRNVRITKLNEPGHEEIVAKIARRSAFDPNKVYTKMIKKMPPCE